MKIQSPQQVIVVAAPRPAPPAPQGPVDQVHTGSTSDFPQMARMAVTGLGGLALAVPTAYAGMAGGALVGSALGGAVGPVQAAFTTHGIAESLGAAWQGAGTYGHYGLVLGGATALVGAFATSAMAGQWLEKKLGGPAEAREKPVNWSNGANLTAGTILLSSGIAAGAVGGLLLGGGAAAAGQLVSGLASHGFNAAALTGVGHSALLGGAIAAPVAAFVGAKGGATMAKFLGRRVIDPATQAARDAIHGKSHDHTPSPLMEKLGTAAKEHPLGALALKTAQFAKEHPGWLAWQGLNIGLVLAAGCAPGSETLQTAAMVVAGASALNNMSKPLMNKLPLDHGVLAEESRGLNNLFGHFGAAVFQVAGTASILTGNPLGLAGLGLGVFIEGSTFTSDKIVADANRKFKEDQKTT